jgi:predicted Zn-dependent protease
MPSSPTTGDVTRTTYSKEELVDIYALAKLCLESGQLKRAETITLGLTAVAPEFLPGWLARSVMHASSGNIEAALEAARKALRIQPDSAAAMMLVVTTALTLGDASTAGTYLGEVSDLIEQGRIADPHLLRLFRMQMSRYNRGK